MIRHAETPMFDVFSDRRTTKFRLALQDQNYDTVADIADSMLSQSKSYSLTIPVKI
jgi:hypothetical protein